MIPVSHQRLLQNEPNRHGCEQQASTYEVPPTPGAELRPALEDFLRREEQMLAGLHAVIGPSGQEPPSEALATALVV